MKPYTMFILFFMLCYANHIYSQNRERSIKEIDSLKVVYKSLQSDKKLENLHYRLKKSKAVKYIDGELLCYNSLLFNHGSQKRLDSVLFYAHKYESLEHLCPKNHRKINYLINKGNTFQYYLGLTEEGLKSYIEAYQLIDKDSVKTLNELSTYISWSYIKKEEYDRAITILNESLLDSSTATNIYRQGQLSYLAMAYQLKKMPEKSLPILQKMLAYSKKNNDTVLEAYVKNNIIYDYYLLGEYQKAIDSGLAVRPKLKGMDLQKHLPTNSEFLALFYDTIGDTKNAIYYMKDAISTTLDYNEIPELYKDLASYHEKDNDVKSALEIYKKREVVIDSIRTMERKVFTDYYDTKIKFIDETQKSEKILLEKNILTAQNDKQKLYIISLIVGLSCILLVILSSIIYRKYYKAEKKVVALKKKEKELLKNHIKVREDELAAMLVTQAQKTEELAHIESRFDNAIVSNDHDKILQSKKLLSEFINASECNDIFSERIESQYPGIVHQLQQEHPELSSNDIKHCLFLKLGLSLKESAQLLNVAIGTVKTSRNRAKTKMKLPDEISLKEYIDQLVNEEILA